MHKGIAVSPGVVVGVAHRVESVFGSGEPGEPGRPALVPVEIERFNRAVATSAAELEAIVQKVGAAARRGRGGHLPHPPDDRRRTRALLAKVRDLVADAGADGAVGLADGLAGLRRHVRPPRARLLPRADGRRPRRDLADRLAPEPRRHAGRRPARRQRLGPNHDGDEPIILVAHEILPSQAMSLGYAADRRHRHRGRRRHQPRRHPRPQPRHPGRLRLRRHHGRRPVGRHDHRRRPRRAWSRSGPTPRRSPPTARCSASSSSSRTA